MKHEFNDIALMVEPERYSAILRMEAAGQTPQWVGRKTERVGTIGVVPIFGIIAEDGPEYWERYYAFASKIVPRLNELAADSSVSSIVLLMDTPGGSCSACEKISAAVQATAKVKPVETFVDGMSCSAGMHIAAYTNKVTATPGSVVGSIGVIATYYDYSKMFEEIGIKAHVLTTGQMKAMGVIGAAITDEQKQARMKLIEGLCDDFKLVLMEHRKLSEEQVNKLAEKGDIWTAKQSLEMSLGLVDELGRWEEFVQKRTPGKTGSTPTSQSSVSNKPQPQQEKKTMDPKELRQQIIAACAGIDEKADADFLLEALCSGKEIAQIVADWKDRKHEKEVAALKSELEAVKKENDQPAPAGPGVSAVGTEQKEETSGNPRKVFLEEIERIQQSHFQATGKPLSTEEASRKLAEKNPGIMEQYLKHCEKIPASEYNDGLKSPAPLRIGEKD